MGSNKPISGASAGGPPPAASICCMCGDHGLLPELFRCAACSVRSQHTYCTDRYPKAESYGTCNWCLRAGHGNNRATSSPARSSVKTAVRRPADHSDPVSSVSSSVPAKVAARGDFTSELNKPIKKQQTQQRRLVLRRSASDLGSRARPGRDAPMSPRVARGRPRVRRYKLLEEVISVANCM